MPVKLSPVAYAIIAALLLSAPILTMQTHHDAAPERIAMVAIHD
ncbi:hypothetical protein [Sphingomonas sp. KR3-1]